MLLVAFSRRICCSRVCSARRSAGWPAASWLTAHQPPGHLRAEGLAGGEEGRVRAAKPHRHAEALGAAHHHVGAHLAGRRQQHQRQQVGADDGQRAGLVGGGDLGLHGRGWRRWCRDIAAPARTGWRADRGGVAGCDIDQRPAQRRARVASTARVCGCRSAATATTADPAARYRSAIATASAAAVASSSSDALAIGRPVRSATMVWKFSSASSRPCAISAWYGV